MKIHGCLFRKKGEHWKQRWCIVAKETLYAFRDSSYAQEDFICRLSKCLVVRTEERPGRAHSFQIERGRGDDIVFAAEDCDVLERWMEVLLEETSKQRFSEGEYLNDNLVTMATLIYCVASYRAIGD